jgi:hypothetical protein
VSYRSYEVDPPSAYCHKWRGFATLKDTFDVSATSESDMRQQIDVQMDEYLETHSPFTLDTDEQKEAGK